jgi:hypothetical protein
MFDCYEAQLPPPAADLVRGNVADGYSVLTSFAKATPGAIAKTT